MAGITGAIKDFIVKGPVYKTAHFFTAYLNVAPNKHRLLNAVGLTVGLFGGRWGMDILVGQKPNGDKVHKEDVPLLLQPLHGILAYDHFSDDPYNRWWKVADMTIPAILGGLGAGIGSDMFYSKEFKELHARLDHVMPAIKAGPAAESYSKTAATYTMGQAENDAIYHQGRVWSKFSSLAAVFGSASGFGLIPSWLNYSSTLGTKFTLDAGRKMVAKWLPKNLRAALFNSHCLEPYGQVKLFESLIEHTAHSPSSQNVIEATEGFLRSWFHESAGKVTPAHIEKFKTNLLELREEIAKEVNALAKGNPEKLAHAESAIKDKLSAMLNFKTKPLKKAVDEMIEHLSDPAHHTVGLDEVIDHMIRLKRPEDSHMIAETTRIIEAQRYTAIMRGRNKYKLEGAELKEYLKGKLTGIIEEYTHINRHEKFEGHFVNHLEREIIKLGLDPREAAIGQQGMPTLYARLIGDWFGLKPLLGLESTTDKIRKTQALFIKGLEERHPELVGKAYTPHDISKSSLAAKVTTGAFLATGAGTVAAIALAKDPGMKDLKGSQDTKPAADNTGNASAGEPATPQHIVHSKKERGFVNGRVLDTVEGITGMFNAGIGMHRVHCAVGLTVGSWLGDEVMKALTGWTFAGVRVKKEELIKPLQFMHDKLHFNMHGDSSRDKWMQVVRWGIPGILGTIAVMQGSKLFFQDRTDRLHKARYLDEVDDKAAMAQSEPWSYTSAISGLFGYPSGLPMLPLLNYSTNLGTRFSMASNRKVALPVVGKIWSNNSTLFPFGPPGMVDLLIKEAINNKNRDPELLETYAIGILKPWFDNVTPQQIESFVMKVHEWRDHFLKEGGVPEDMKKQLEKELKAHLKGAGLEETLRDIGLDPLKASIANNGLSGTIANVLGAKGAVEKIKSEYAKGYVERVNKERKDQDPYKTGPTPTLA